MLFAVSSPSVACHRRRIVAFSILSPTSHRRRQYLFAVIVSTSPLSRHRYRIVTIAVSSLLSHHSTAMLWLLCPRHYCYEATVALLPLATTCTTFSLTSTYSGSQQEYVSSPVLPYCLVLTLLCVCSAFARS